MKVMRILILATCLATAFGYASYPTMANRGCVKDYTAEDWENAPSMRAIRTMSGLSRDMADGLEIYDTETGEAQTLMNDMQLWGTYRPGHTYNIRSTLGRSGRSVHILQLREGAPAHIQATGSGSGNCSSGTFSQMKSKATGTNGEFEMQTFEGATARIEMAVLVNQGGGRESFVRSFLYLMAEEPAEMQACEDESGNPIAAGTWTEPETVGDCQHAVYCDGAGSGELYMEMNRRTSDAEWNPQDGGYMDGWCPDATGERSCGDCEVQITIVNFSFQPEAADVAVGQCVCFTNEDGAGHSVQTARSTNAFNSGPSGGLSRGDQSMWTPTAADAGEHAYYCAPHGSMTGMLVVMGGGDEAMGCAAAGNITIAAGTWTRPETVGECQHAIYCDAGGSGEFYMEMNRRASDMPWDPSTGGYTDGWCEDAGSACSRANTERKCGKIAGCQWNERGSTCMDAEPATRMCDENRFGRDGMIDGGMGDPSWAEGPCEGGDGLMQKAYCNPAGEWVREMVGRVGMNGLVWMDGTCADVMGGGEPAGDQCDECSVQIEIVNFSFQPQEARVELGDCVCWTNSDGAGHSVQTANTSGAFSSGDSGGLDSDHATYVWRPTAADVGEGEMAHRYYCLPHTNMMGVLTVVGEPASMGCSGQRFNNRRMYLAGQGDPSWGQGGCPNNADVMQKAYCSVDSEWIRDAFSTDGGMTWVDAEDGGSCDMGGGDNCMQDCMRDQMAEGGMDATMGADANMDMSNADQMERYRGWCSEQCNQAAGCSGQRFNNREMYPAGQGDVSWGEGGCPNDTTVMQKAYCNQDGQWVNDQYSMDGGEEWAEGTCADAMGGGEDAMCSGQRFDNRRMYPGGQGDASWATGPCRQEGVMQKAYCSADGSWTMDQYSTDDGRSWMDGGCADAMSGGDSACDSCAVQISIVNFSFQPEAASVEVGQCVCFTNEDGADHSVQTANTSSAFSSGAGGGLGRGDQFMWEPTDADADMAHAYYCDPHMSMTGEITVIGSEPAVECSDERFGAVYPAGTGAPSWAQGPCSDDSVLQKSYCTLLDDGTSMWVMDAYSLDNGESWVDTADGMACADGEAAQGGGCDANRLIQMINEARTPAKGRKAVKKATKQAAKFYNKWVKQIRKNTTKGLKKAGKIVTKAQRQLDEGEWEEYVEYRECTDN